MPLLTKNRHIWWYALNIRKGRLDTILLQRTESGWRGARKEMSYGKRIRYKGCFMASRRWVNFTCIRLLQELIHVCFHLSNYIYRSWNMWHDAIHLKAHAHFTMRISSTSVACPRSSSAAAFLSVVVAVPVLGILLSRHRERLSNAHPSSYCQTMRVALEVMHPQLNGIILPV